MDLEFEQVTPLQIEEFEKARMDRYGYKAVYHILLMKDALKNLQTQGNPQAFIQAYSIDFTKKHSDCRFHADLSVFKKKGLYLPPGYPDEGHFFSRDPLNVSLSYLQYRSRQSPETIALGNMDNDICDHHWTADDFADTEKLQQGLVHGQLIWLGTVSSFRHYEEPKLDANTLRLTNGLFEYYRKQIGPININEGDSTMDFTVIDNGRIIHLG